MKKYSIFFVIIFYLVAILIVSVDAIRCLYPNYGNFESLLYTIIIPILFSIISYSILDKKIKIRNKLIRFVLLFIMIYFALIFGNNFVFKFILRKMIDFCESEIKKYREEYNILLAVLVNDTYNMFLYILGLFYSFISCLCYFIFIKIKNNFLKKNKFYPHI